MSRMNEIAEIESFIKQSKYEETRQVLRSHLDQLQKIIPEEAVDQVVGMEVYEKEVSATSSVSIEPSTSCSSSQPSLSQPQRPSLIAPAPMKGKLLCP